MSRGLSALNQAEASARHLHAVLFAELLLTTSSPAVPITVHTSVGPLTFGGDTYLGVGDLGGVSGVDEAERIGPSPFKLSLSGVDPGHIADALHAGNHRDKVTLWVGYRGDDGLLVDDPWRLAGGFFEYADIELGEADNRVVVTVQHDLSTLLEKHGGRYTNEDQQGRFSGDVGFSFVADVIDKKLVWAGTPVTGTGTAQPVPRRGK